MAGGAVRTGRGIAVFSGGLFRPRTHSMKRPVPVGVSRGIVFPYMPCIHDHT